MGAERCKAKADACLKKKGREVTFIRSSDSGFDPATGDSTVSETTFTAYVRTEDYKLGEIDGTVVQMGDRKLTAQAIDEGLKVNDEVNLEGEVWRVMHVMPHAPSGTVIRYEAVIRK